MKGAAEVGGDDGGVIAAGTNDERPARRGVGVRRGKQSCFAPNKFVFYLYYERNR